MRLILFALAALVAHASSKTTRAPPPTTDPPPTMEERVKHLEDILNGLTRQVMLQQFFVEEKVRSDGNSGLKQTRVNRDGTKNYYQPAHIDRNFMAMHDHANYDRTVGLGELMPVMNGVEFRTRHNDYKLRMPSRTESTYHKIEDIPFPDVPRSVLNKKTVQEQIEEMREYFRAFNEQNVTHRDYRPYFRPVLCYIEGAWTLITKTLNEPFQSDRHAIDADSWFDLMDKIRFTSYTGSKSVNENFAYLPTTIIAVEKGFPIYAQWNYRIVCHPLKDDLPLSVFKQEDDLLYRFPNRLTMEQIKGSRAERFRINEKAEDHYGNGKSLLDDLMMQIPGKDNYPADLKDYSFDMTMEDVRYNNHTLINTGYYHRYFKTLDKGAMGIKSIHRGFSDANLWVAQTTQPQVAPMTATSCHGRGRTKQCKSWTARYSYALPLEIIYMTPLLKWNPYDLETDVDDLTVRDHGKRTGGTTAELAYNGTNFKLFYLTPAEFYNSGNVERDPADTAKKGAGVLDKNGQLRIMASSGVRIRTPEIAGVGMVRMRYPIMPIHGEGSAVWKELNALKDMTMHMNRYSSLFVERPGYTGATNRTNDMGSVLHYQLSLTLQDPPGEHVHDFFLTMEEVDELKHGHRITVTTSEEMGHSHILELKWRRNQVQVNHCDGRTHCWDGHSNVPRLLRG